MTSLSSRKTYMSIAIKVIGLWLIFAPLQFAHAAWTNVAVPISSMIVQNDGSTLVLFSSSSGLTNPDTTCAWSYTFKLANVSSDITRALFSQIQLAYTTKDNVLLQVIGCASSGTNYNNIVSVWTANP